MLTLENVKNLQWKGAQNEPPIPSVVLPSRYSMDPPSSAPFSSYHAVAHHELPDKDQELTKMDVNLIVLLVQSEDFNQATYHNLLVKCFDCSLDKANLLARVAAANQKA